MGKLKVLFIGGGGGISSPGPPGGGGAGIDLYVLNRGQNTTRPLPAGTREMRADVRNPASVRDAIENHEFDSVVDFVAFAQEHVRSDIEIFRDRTKQYVFISTASAYQKPPERLPHPTAATRPVLPGGGTSLARMRAGKPVIVHGDGTSLWTVTHHDDFARAFVPLLGHPRTYGEAFHITSDDVLTWNQIARALADALGVTARIVHVPSDVIAAADPEWGAGLLGDKAHSMVFDNSKVRSVVPGWRATIPFERGASQIADWYLADPARQVVNDRLDALMDKLAADF